MDIDKMEVERGKSIIEKKKLDKLNINLEIYIFITKF